MRLQSGGQESRAATPPTIAGLLVALLNLGRLAVIHMPICSLSACAPAGWMKNAGMISASPGYPDSCGRATASRNTDLNLLLHVDTGPIVSDCSSSASCAAWFVAIAKTGHNVAAATIAFGKATAVGAAWTRRLPICNTHMQAGRARYGHSIFRMLLRRRSAIGYVLKRCYQNLHHTRCRRLQANPSEPKRSESKNLRRQ